jgi:multidrug efflux pump subunit AcrB
MIEQLIKRRLMVGLAMFLLLSTGFITMYQLPRREIPIIQHPIAILTTIYPGAAPHQVESYVTNRLEESLSEIAGIEEVVSSSQAGLSQITITVEDYKKQDQVWNKVQQKIDQVHADLPGEAGRPSLQTDLQMQGVAIYQLLADQEEDLLLLEGKLDKWETAFRQVSGVVQVQIQGLPEQELLLQVDPGKLSAIGLTPAQLISLIETEINPLPPGQWVMEKQVYGLYLPLSSPDQLLQIPVTKNSSGDTVYLKETATIDKVYPQDREIVTYQGKPSISLSFFASNERDLLTIDKQLYTLIQEMEQELPPEIQVVQVYSQAEPIQKMLHDLGRAFILAMIFVLLICSVGLNIYVALGVGISIPLALCGGMLVLPWAGVDMNQISLIAFIIVLGILVDDAIVVNENISRHLAESMPHHEAIVSGTGEVAVSVISSTLIVVFTFFPLLFLSGSAGDFIRPLPVVIISSIIASTIAALFFIPVFRFWLYQRFSDLQTAPRANRMHKAFQQLREFYSVTVLSNIINAPVKFVLGGLIISFLAFGLVKFIPVEFFPDVEREELFVEIEFHPSTSMAVGKDKVGRIQTFISGQKGVREVNTYYGSSMPRIFGMSTSTSTGLDKANILVFINREQANARQMKDDLTWLLEEAFPQERFSLSVVESGPAIGAPLALRMDSDSLTDLQGASEEIRQLLLSYPGVLSVKDDIGQGVPTVLFQPSPAALQLNNMQAWQISQGLRLYGDGIVLGEINDGNALIDLRLKYDKELQGVSRDEQQILIFNNQGDAFPLSSVASSVTELELSSIVHHNYQRSNTVKAYLDSGTKADQVLKSLNQNIEGIIAQYPQVSLEVEGETAARNEVFVEMGKIFLVVLLLILIVIAVQFNSIALALIILSTVLLSCSGALYTLFISGTALGFMSLMGVISLAGIVVRNGIILIEFMEARVRAGIEADTAIQEACRQRFRPIVLTSATTFFSLMPLALGDNLMFKPLAICIAGGLLYSALLTLLVIPSLYYLWKKRQQFSVSENLFV